MTLESFYFLGEATSPSMLQSFNQKTNKTMENEENGQNKNNNNNNKHVRVDIIIIK